ncbi:MAG: sulfatase-like hydrolase/transferase [Candidatus Glassbacteria bacterium]|nr:sulfatase-like hydrolase/transferase [Candidatus Glassbacteria bacterium]
MNLPRLIRFYSVSLTLLAAVCASPPDFNIIIVTLDTTRADRLGCYGYERAHTPSLDSLAVDGVLFENAFTTSPITLPAHASLFTGLYPPVHGVRDNGIYRLEDEAVTLAEVLGEAGMNTGAAIGAYVLSSRFGLAQGFDHYDERLKGQPGAKAAFYVERSAGEVTDAALEWLNGLGHRRPFFLWVHYFDPHSPCRPPAPYDSLCPGRPYDGEVAYMDSQLGRLLDCLRESGEYERTLIVAVGDHGEALGQHGEPTHGIFIYDPTVRIPLLVKYPGGELAGKRVSGNVSLVDLFPTVLEAAGLEWPGSIQGRSLLHDNSPGERAVYLETLMPEQTFGWHRLEGLVQGNMKYVDAPVPELYDLTADPGETQNLVESEPDRAQRMSSRLAALKWELERESRQLAGRMELDSESAERLRALGYISGGAAAHSPDSLPDPKLMIGSLGRFMEGVMAEAEGEYAAALAAFDSVLADDPENLYAIRYKGFVLMEQDSMRLAIEQFTRAVELQPESPANFMLALAWSRLGSVGETRSWLERTVKMQPGHARAHAMLADILLDCGETAVAVEHMETARRLAPQDKRVLNDLGSLLLERGEPEAAAESFEEALAVDPDYPLALYNLGIARYRLGELEEAEEVLARVAADFTGDKKVQNNLGVVRAARQDREGAERAYRAALDADSSFAPAWNNLGNVMAATGRTNEAAAAYSSALEIEPDYAEACFNYGILLAERLELPDSALMLIERGIALAPDSPRALKMGDFARELRAR